MEEQVGALWHKLITGVADKRYPAEAVTLEQISKTAGILFRAWGGDSGLAVKSASATRHEAKRTLLQRAHATDQMLRGRTVLVVDDDVRNIFAVASVLERQGVRVLYAENGRAGIEILRADPGIDAVLMDIMMPEMDGYDTMTAIRRMPGLRTLPIIALTAKAMKGDRERCIEAGASDYITKPLDTDQLLSLLRVWLHATPTLPEARA